MGDDRLDISPEELAEYQAKWAGRLRSECDSPGRVRPASDGRNRGVRYNVTHDMRDLVNRRGREPGDSGGSFGQNGGVPPADSTYRCQAMRNDGGGRCKQWAVRGGVFCGKHGGRPKTDRVVVPEIPLEEALTGLPDVYSKLLGPRLAAALKEAQEGPLDDLRQELDIMKVMAADAVKLWADADECESVTAQERMALGLVAREHLTHVVDVAEKIARIQGKAGPVDPNALSIVVQQFVGITRDVIGDDCGLVTEIARRVGEIRLPTKESAAGTLLTPDLDVQEMDAMVPRPQVLAFEQERSA